MCASFLLNEGESGERERERECCDGFGADWATLKTLSLLKRAERAEREKSENGAEPVDFPRLLAELSDAPHEPLLRLQVRATAPASLSPFFASSLFYMLSLFAVFILFLLCLASLFP